MAAPVNTVAPANAGTLRTLSTLTGILGTWTGADTIAQQWQRAMPVRDDGALVIDDGEIVTGAWESISGATSLNYKLLPTETEYMVRRREVATNGDGSTTAYTAQSGPIGTYLPGPLGLGAIKGALQHSASDEQD